MVNVGKYTIHNVIDPMGKMLNVSKLGSGGEKKNVDVCWKNAVGGYPALPVLFSYHQQNAEKKHKQKATENGN